ncbi:MAG: hypothetical protein U9N61_02850 [Euryarchaeota archaeon]|nr:hypothetical protein [Euryarchaeota archaeon]
MSDTKDVGISEKAIKLGKVIDRLHPGEYCVILKKPRAKPLPWHTIIYKTDRIRVMDIPDV